MSDVTISSTVEEIRPRASEWRRFRRVFLGRPVVTFGLVVIMIFVLVAVFAAVLAAYDPIEPDMSNTLASPAINIC